MAKKVICPICGTEFITNRPNKKYCSFSCKGAAEMKQRIKWGLKNPEYNKNYMKAYRAKKKGEVKQ